MARNKNKHRKKSGLPPGSLIFTGEQKVEHPYLIHTIYDAENYEAVNLKGKALPEMVPGRINWFDVRGLSNIELIESLGKLGDIHPLVLEDVLNPSQRPKFDEYDNGVFFILQSLSIASHNFQINTEQIGLYIGDQWVISFQEDETDLFLSVRERLEAGRGRIRSKDASYLGYALIDAVVDNYFVVVDILEEEVENVEDEIMSNPTSRTKSRIHNLKRESLTLRKAVVPLWEAVSRFSRSESRHISDNTYIFVRDLHDHLAHISEHLENYRDLLNGLYDLYLSEISFKLNNVMQVLTVVSTIFIPLTFLAGIYGMNFDHMPELHWRYSYFVVWGIMIAIAITLLLIFRRKDWL